MNIFIKILPVVLISVIFYIMFYNIYPQYQETINLVKKLNELNNKEKEVKNLENLIKAIGQNVNLKQILAQREILNLWLPKESKLEEIIYSLDGIYKGSNLIFRGTDFIIEKEPKYFNQNVLPLKVINFTLLAKVDENSLLQLIDGIEKNSRLMVVKKAVLRTQENSEILVESYYQQK